jgi:hypothetical protein
MAQQKGRPRRVGRLAVISFCALAGAMLLFIVAVVESLSVIYVTSAEDIEELVIVRGSRPSEHSPWLSGKDWALDIFLVDHDQQPEVHAVVNGKPRICDTTYFSTFQVHVTTVHIPVHGPCQETTTRIP